MADENLVREQIQTSAPTLREMAMVLFRQRRMFVWVSALVLAYVVFYAFAGSRYQAHMKILVRPGRADTPISAQENAPLDLTRLKITEEELNSELELLRDDEVLRKAAEESGLADHDWLYLLRKGEGRAERIERAARRLAKRLRAEQVKKTNLIAVEYASDEPRLAAKVLRSLEKAYLEKHLALRRPSGEMPFFEQQTEESRRQLDKAESELLRFAANHGIVSAAQQRDLALQKLGELEGGYRQTQIELAETQQRVLTLEAELPILPERSTTQIRTADNPELLKALKSNLLELQLRRTQLLNKFEPSHRLVKEVEEQIGQAQAAIAAENFAPVRDETTDRNSQYEWVKSELERAQVQLKALQARGVATKRQESAYQSMARRLGEDAITQDDLQSTERAAQENYLLYVKKREEARMADALDRRGIVNVAVAEEPVAPALPLWSTWTLLALGFAAAGIAGTGAAFAVDYLDPALRSPEEVLAYLNVPVLASLPQDTRRRQLA